VAPAVEKKAISPSVHTALVSMSPASEEQSAKPPTPRAMSRLPRASARAADRERSARAENGWSATTSAEATAPRSP
jgi:hypothetical protein